LTGGTLAKAADLMMEKSIERKSNLYTRHFIWRCLRKIEKSQLLELIVTDSIPLKKESKNKSVELCTTFLQVMHMVHHNNSIAENLSCKS
jgi:ribose-phosphate pyrophosphokinase